MKKLFLTLVLAIMATGAVNAQQIAVVSTSGETSLHQTLGEAIEGAAAGSVIYLPGGGFPIADEVKITKKLTIIGIGHKIKTDNADGYTTITGNLWFNEGSDGSSVMGVYMTGNVNIGHDNNKVDNVLVRYCNMNDVNVYSIKCLGTVVNQNYIRGGAYFNTAPCDFTNNIVNFVRDLDNGTIDNNVFLGRYLGRNSAIDACDCCSIKNNVILGGPNGLMSGDNSFAEGNMAKGIIQWGSTYDIDPINVTDVEWTDIFVNPSGVNANSDYHFKGEYEQYNSQCGIYAGSGFSDSALPPVPYIVSKQIPEQTDAEGKLDIRIRVRAGE